MNEKQSKLNRRKFLHLAALTTASVAVGGLPVSARAAAADTAAKPKIGIIGSGKIGGTLGSLWAGAGHEVMFSSRNIDNDKKLAASVGPKARAGTPREAAAFGDVVLIAVPYKALPELGKDLGDAIKGKVVINPSNPIPNRDGDIANQAREKGVGYADADLLPGARVVRAFNAIGAAKLPEYSKRQGGERTAMPIAGDDQNALAVTSALVREIGLEPVVVGGIAMGKYLVPGTPLAGEHSPEEIRKIVATLK
jgi:8-hydroxy-5-deazaflavin:NADPH oxidoreductase